MGDVKGPLDGVRVVEFGQYIAVPGAAQILADQGADVIKIEAPGGEASRRLPGYGAAMFHAYNRGKRMVELDLKSDEGLAAARQLALSADVVMSNVRPGAMERMGIGATQLLEAKPDTVCVTLTGFGDSGTMQNRPGLDIAAQAESGIMWVTGESDREPQRVGFPVVDAAATTVIAQAVTAALLARHRTGEGADIRVSLWDVAIQLQAANWMEFALTGVDPARSGNAQPGAAPAAEVIGVLDGFIVLSAYTAPHWAALCRLIAHPEYITDERFTSSPTRIAHRKEMCQILSDAFAHLSRAEAVALLTDAGLVAGAIKSYSEAFKERSAEPRELFMASNLENPPWYVGPAAWWEGVVVDARPPKDVGADNDQLDDPWRSPLEHETPQSTQLHPK